MCRPSKHHRKAKSLGGTNYYKNISKVGETKHQAFHTLFGRGNPSKIVAILNSTWLDPDYYFILKRR